MLMYSTSYRALPYYGYTESFNGVFLAFSCIFLSNSKGTSVLTMLFLKKNDFLSPVTNDFEYRVHFSCNLEGLRSIRGAGIFSATG